jgi:pyridoxal biosynthesis lyase PdxS
VWQGFVTRVSNGSFDIYVSEPIGDHRDGGIDILTIDIDDEGNVTTEQNTEYVFTKHTYETNAVCGIVHDISHRVKREAYQSIAYMRDTFYKKQEVTKKKKVSKNSKKTIDKVNKTK